MSGLRDLKASKRSTVAAVYGEGVSVGSSLQLHPVFSCLASKVIPAPGYFCIQFLFAPPIASIRRFLPLHQNRRVVQPGNVGFAGHKPDLAFGLSYLASRKVIQRIL
jgi:hypothetical protein